MNTLDFKNWLETNEVDAQKEVDSDPTLSAAKQGAEQAQSAAIERGQDPIKAYQMAINKAKVPSNKIGLLMPKDQLAVQKMKKKMKKR